MKCATLGLAVLLSFQTIPAHSQTEYHHEQTLDLGGAPSVVVSGAFAALDEGGVVRDIFVVGNLSLFSGPYQLNTPDLADYKPIDGPHGSGGDTLQHNGTYAWCYKGAMRLNSYEIGDRTYWTGSGCTSPAPSPPPERPPDLIACDPGHPPCGGNGTSDEPLILDLNGDGIHTSALETSPVMFDMNADGRRDQTAWTDPNTEEAFLFYDRNHNKVVDGNQELFGNRTPLPNGTIAATGVDALAAYDKKENGGNGDGVIAPGDTTWGILRVWIDRNHDGVATESETYALGELGIEAIDLTFERLGADQSYGVDNSGNFHVFKGHFSQRLRGTAASVRREVHDVYFRVMYH
jgi:hypothetical protein